MRVEHEPPLTIKYLQHNSRCHVKRCTAVSLPQKRQIPHEPRSVIGVAPIIHAELGGDRYEGEDTTKTK